MSSPPHRPDTNQLAAQRTWLAHERTLMAWVRTSMSMIGFGFTIYKFFQLEQESHPKPRAILTPRDFAIAMVSIGITAMMLAIVQRRWQTKSFDLQLGAHHRSIAEAVAVLVFVFGLGVLATAIWRG